MKWKLPLFAILMILAIVPASYVSAMVLLPQAGQPERHFISQSATVSITFSFYVPGLDAPTGFVLTDLEGITASANWTKDTEATYTMIRISRFDYPTSPEEGELAYYGPAENCTIPGVYFDGLVIYATAISFEADNTTYSSEYATASIGDGTVGEVADALESSVALMDVVWLNAIALLVVLVFTGLAYWHRDKWLYIIAGAGWILYGVYGLNNWEGLGFLAVLMWMVGAYNFLKAAWDKPRRRA